MWNWRNWKVVFWGGVSPLVKELVCAEHVGISAGEEDERRALMPNKEE